MPARYFRVLRAWSFELGHAENFAKFGEGQFKDTIRWNVAQGKALTAMQISRVEAKRTELYHRVREFLETYEYLILPTAQVPPFPIEWEYPSVINGIEMKTYIDWMMSCAFITITGLPAISVPCGLTEEGLPVGLQIVGRPTCRFRRPAIGLRFSGSDAILQAAARRRFGDAHKLIPGSGIARLAFFARAKPAKAKR